jgi:UDP-N-acetylglucosamine transferase subunit ALG13
MFKIFKNTKRAIAVEHEALEKLIATHHFDLIISDNRYGIYNDKIHTVFISHQINIQVPAYLKWLQPLLLSYNLKLISKFKECWIPDIEGKENLSGTLSHHCKLPDNSYYIGFLSRFFSLQSSVGSWQLSTEDCQLPTPLTGLPTANSQLLILLSGPEPQRTIFEEIVLSQLHDIKYKTLIVQGLTQKQEVKQLSENITMISFLTASDLFRYMASAEMIISRSGYSTIMDLAAVGCKALLVPTPGQTEQEYLANKFMDEAIFYSIRQADFKIADIEKAKTFSGLSLKSNPKVLQQRIKTLLS